jgi:hypothetical protein
MEKGEILLAKGDEAGAFDAFNQCFKVSPGSTTCLSDLAAVEANEGKCDDLVNTGRRFVALVPTSPQPYQRLAEGLLGRGEPLDVVRASLQPVYEREGSSGRRSVELTTDIALAIHEGDFSAAMRTSDQLEKLGDSSDPEAFSRAYTRMLLELESGNNTRAAERAKRYLKESAALSAYLGRLLDNSLNAYEIQRSAGGITSAKFDELRDQWLARTKDEMPWFRWVTAYAKPAITPEDARAAIAAKPAGPIVSPIYMSAEIAEPTGRAYFLAGDLDEGIRYLTAASSSCALLDGTSAIFSTWGAYDLGRALEARGDVPGACRAYSRVLARWGAAKPFSSTAKQAAERRTVLACAP